MENSTQPTNNNSFVTTTAVNPNDLTEEQKNADLEKLNALSQKLSSENPLPQANVEEEPPEVAALKIENPFKGE